VLIDYLVNRARTYIYTTATPPILAAVLRESLNILRTEDWRRERLAELVIAFRQALERHAPKLIESRTAIQPLVLGEANQAVAVSRARKSRVPAGTARLRISLSAAHCVDDVRALARALHEVLE
jgi:8-amino-7-oxononanoate synthase